MATVKTAAWLGGFSGRLQNVYFAQTAHGTEMRTLPERDAPYTKGELAQQARIAKVARAWNALDREAMLAWRSYAEGRSNPAEGSRRTGLSAYNAFSGLASKCLQLRPETPVPSLPPTAPFFGDALTVTAQGGPVLTFGADQANAAGVVTELLLQPLKSAGRTPRPKAYVSAGFFAFEAGELAAVIDAAPGWYACAYRFVRSETGQETALAPCGFVRVG